MLQEKIELTSDHEKLVEKLSLRDVNFAQVEASFLSSEVAELKKK